MYTVETDYFDLDQIYDSGQCFRWEKTGEKKYLIPAFGRQLAASQDANMLSVSCDKTEYESIWEKYFDLDEDYKAVCENISKNDTYMLKAAEYGKGIRILRQDLWEMMITSILTQNNNIPRIKKCTENLCVGVDPDKPYIFPTAGEILCAFNPELLKKAGLGYRSAYIWELCEYVEKNPDYLHSLRQMKYGDAMKTLLERKGIGEKVANCICLFGLHQVDACPVDVWIKKMIDKYYNHKMPAWMSEPKAGIYQQYMFYEARNQKG